jgi:hypothetical protein
MRFLLPLLLIAPAAAHGDEPGPPVVPLHGQSELTLTASRDAEPDTEVRVEFKSERGTTVTVSAFHAGGRTWKARFRPDEPGSWLYRATSRPAVPGLDGPGGSFVALRDKTDNPLLAHGPVRVAKSGTHLEHADGTPFFFLADTCWTGPALSSEADWQAYLADRKAKKFTAVQFNIVSPWRTAPTDTEGNTSYTVADGKLVPNEAFYRRLDARMKAINDAGLLAVPVLCWAHKKGDAGMELSEKHLVELIRFEVERYKSHHVLWILAGDNGYNREQSEKWKRIGRAVFGDKPAAPVTTHPTGQNWPWMNWEEEKWLTVLGYQSGHGDAAATWKWLHSGPPAVYGRRKEFARPVINLEPPYEDHNGYQSRKPHSDYSVRRAVYWSLLVHPPAGVTYGGHGVWSWHTKPGGEPTDHKGTGIAKTWKEALALPGAAQMGHVRTLFESLPWTQLRPAQDLIDQVKGKDDPAKFVACAATPDRKTIVAYFPAGATAALTIPAPGDDALTWFDPRTGRTKKGGGLTPPDAQDWVLVIKP